MKVKCPYCNYDGNLKEAIQYNYQIYPISFPMFCGKCRMKFYPETDMALISQIKESLEDIKAGRIKKQ
jgi:hypothetical protein